MKTIKDIYDERVIDFDEMNYGACFEDCDYSKLKSYNKQTTIALLENLVEWLETLQIVANHNPMYNDKEYDSYNNGYNTAIDDTVKYLQEQIKLISK